MVLAMTVDERIAFVQEAHVAVLAVERDDGPPLMTPIWYQFLDGIFSVHTARTHLKTRLLRNAGRFSLCIQTESPPYKYVSVEGSIIAIDPIPPEERRAMVCRYFDPDRARAYLRQTQAAAPEDLAIRMRPERWRTVDFSKEEDTRQP